MTETRKLATILALDVAGFSRAMEKDDAAAADSVRELRAAVAEIVAPFGGRIFNTAGDGLMLEFPAASSGVQAAMALIAESKSGVRPLPRIRIGLHLGEVIVAEGGDLLGHGVNVAARLQALAEPGSALVSEAVRSQVRSAAVIPFAPQGRVQLDKMSETLAVFALNPGGGSARLSKIARRRLVRAAAAGLALLVMAGLAWAAWRTLGSAPSFEAAEAGAPRLAVLRFESLGDTEPYFAEGMADELIAEASRIRGLEVTARTSSFALEAADATAAAAADMLGATLVLTGSVRRLPETIRVQAQLVEAPSGRQLWNETFEQPAEDVFALQREIAVRVARAAGLRTAGGAPRRIDPEAYRLYLEGREALMLADRQALDSALDLLRAAVDLEPDFAQAWTDLARAEATVAYDAFFWAPPGETLDRDELQAALAATDAASRLEGGAGVADVLAADFLSRVGSWTEAAAAKARAERAGFDAGPRFLLQVGRAREALAAQRRLVELDPLDVDKIVELANYCSLVRDHACQRDAAERAYAIAPDDSAAIFQLAGALTELGEGDAARRLLADNASIMRGHFVFTAPFDERYFAWRRGDAPAPDAAAILAQVEAGEVYLEAATQVLVETGELEAARSLLDAWGPAQWPMLYFLYDTQLGALRDTPEFWALMERAGLTAHWRDSGQWPDFCDREPVCPR